MNKYLSKLIEIANKPSRRIVGLMSGTSVDGLDVAVCKITGSGNQTRLKLEFFETVPYSQQQKELLQKLISSSRAELENVCLMNEWIGKLHAGIVLNCLEKWKLKNEEIDLIASHGQTIYHAPFKQHQREGFPNATLQLGDGDHIAVDTGVITISDFRQKHLAAGGEGAPLAAYGDFILFASDEEDIILLNIGGISNFTYIPSGKNFSQVVCSDTGPGNTLIDNYVQRFFPDKHFDESGGLASKGQINEELLSILSDHNFFRLPLPKTTGREIFHFEFIEQALARLNDKNVDHFDVIATLTFLTSITIANAIRSVARSSQKNTQVLVSGGGMHNQALMNNLKKLLPDFLIGTTSDKQINPDAKEAILFAVLANELVSGNASIFEDGPADMPAVTMGKISLPG